MKRLPASNKVTAAIGIGILILVIISIILIRTVRERGAEYRFEEGYNHLEATSNKYNTSFHTEILNETMPSLGDIPNIIKEIQEFESTLSKKSNDPEMSAIFLFIDIRKLMLTSQWYFQKGKEIGNVGLVNDEEGFSCTEAPQITDAAYYYNESFIYGLQAEEEIDDLLYMHKYHPKLWQLVGIDENKTKFFKSDLRSIRHIPINNLKSLEVYCNMRGIKHETTYTKGFEYEREIVPKEFYRLRYPETSNA